VSRPAGEAPEQLDHAITRLERRGAVAERLVERVHLGDSIEAAALARQLADDAEAMRRAQQEVEAAVGQPLVLRDEAGAADLVRRRIARHLPRSLGPHRDHPDPAVARERVLHHLAIARLEDVERDGALRQQHHVLEREERKPRRHARNILDGGSPRRDPARPWMRSCGTS
jgi:hypothetical protein